MSELPYIEPVPGAAQYQAEKMATNKWAVVMYPSDEPNFGSVVQNGFLSFDTARKSANSWQKKENRLVLKYHTRQL